VSSSIRGDLQCRCHGRELRSVFVDLNSEVHIVRVTGVEDSRRFLRELDEAPGGNNLHYILQCLRVLALVTRV